MTPNWRPLLTSCKTHSDLTVHYGSESPHYGSVSFSGEYHLRFQHFFLDWIIKVANMPPLAPTATTDNNKQSEVAVSSNNNTI